MTEQGKETKATRKRFVDRGRLMSPLEIEQEILEQLDFLEDLLSDLTKYSIAAARAEAVYKREHAKSIIRSTTKAVSLREHEADFDCSGLFEERRVAEGLRDSTQEACRVRRSIVEGLRTLSANTRSAESGRG